MMLTVRDINAEREFLLSIGHLDYVLLQRDWDAPSHGDLDLAITAHHWPELISALIEFSNTHNYPIVKVYEIEHAVICIIILTDIGALHLDIAITPHVSHMFSVPLLTAIQRRESSEDIYIITQAQADTYSHLKKIYKNSSISRLLQKARNSRILIRRLIAHSRLIRGVLLYIPYILDEQILRSPAIINHATQYLTNDMKSRYNKK